MTGCAYLTAAECAALAPGEPMPDAERAALILGLMAALIVARMLFGED